MKKILSGLCVFVMLFSQAGALSLDETTAVQSETAKNITIKYSNYTNEQISAFVYDITNVEDADINTEFIDKETTPIIGVEQKLATGSFIIPVDKNLSAKVIIMIAGELSSSSRFLLEIVDGIPYSIETDYDAKNLKRILGSSENVEIGKGASLKNAVIDATEGAVIMNDAVLTGKIVFNANGEIDVNEGDTVKISGVYDVNTGTTKQAFMQKAQISNGDSSYTFSIDTYENGEYIKTTQKSIEFEPIYEGTALFGIGIYNIPDGIELICK